MRLFLPQHLAQPPKPSGLPFSTFLTYSNATGKSDVLATSEIVARLARLSQSDALALICAISARLSMEKDYQRSLVSTLLPADLRPTALAALSSGPVSIGIFHRRQLWLLIQLAIVSCGRDAVEQDDQTKRHLVGECCLLANDVLQQIEPDPDVPIDVDLNSFFSVWGVPFSERQLGPECLARSQAFWFDIPATDAFKQCIAKHDVSDFSQAFTSRYGICFRRFYLILVAIQAAFLSNAGHRSAPLLYSSELLRPYFTGAEIEAAFRCIAQTPVELLTRILGQPRQHWSLDATPLFARPLIEVRAKEYACPDPNALARYFVDGVYYLLREAYEGSHFATLFGCVFEHYVLDALREFSVESDVLAASLFPSPVFNKVDGKGAHDEAGDAILVCSQQVLVFEFKSRLMTTRDRFSGDVAVTTKGINDVLFVNRPGGRKGGGQLAHNIGRILSGDRVRSRGGQEIAFPHNAIFLPIIVTIEDALSIDATRKTINAAFQDSLPAHLHGNAKVGELLVLNLHDIEALASSAPVHTLRAVLSEYLTALAGQTTLPWFGTFQKFIADHPRFSSLGNKQTWVGLRASAALTRVTSDFTAMDEQREKA